MAAPLEVPFQAELHGEQPRGEAVIHEAELAVPGQPSGTLFVDAHSSFRASSVTWSESDVTEVYAVEDAAEEAEEPVKKAAPPEARRYTWRIVARPSCSPSPFSWPSPWA